MCRTMYPEYMVDYEITPSQLEAIVSGPEREQVVLLDVREPFEVQICAVPGSRHIPMRQPQSESL